MKEAEKKKRHGSVKNNEIKYLCFHDMLRECAKRTGISYEWLRQACNKNHISHIRCGKKIMVNYPKLLDLLNSRGLRE